MGVVQQRRKTKQKNKIEEKFYYQLDPIYHPARILRGGEAMPKEINIYGGP
jgi:hypothetical protein